MPLTPTTSAGDATGRRKSFCPSCRRDFAHEESDDMIDHDADQVPDPLEIETYFQGSVPD